MKKRWWSRLLPAYSRHRVKSAGYWTRVDRGERLQRVASGFQFTEGPLWLADEKALLFSDIPADRIYRASEAGQTTVFREPSGQSNGLCRAPDGGIVACEHQTRRVTLTEAYGQVQVLADRFEGRRLNSPNDAVMSPDGKLFFTDPPYGIQPDQQEQPTQGLYRLDPDGTLALVADDFEKPNGLALSPDLRLLYVADSSALSHVRSFAVRADGTLSGGGIFLELNVPSGGSPDGLKVDAEGYLYCAGPDGIWVVDPQGRHLGTILTPERPANCNWGGAESKMLYIAARTSIYRIRLKTSGFDPVSPVG